MFVSCSLVQAHMLVLAARPALNHSRLHIISYIWKKLYVGASGTAVLKDTCNQFLGKLKPSAGDSKFLTVSHPAVQAALAVLKDDTHYSYSNEEHLKLKLCGTTV